MAFGCRTLVSAGAQLTATTGLFFRRAYFWLLFPSPRRHAAYDHKRDQDGKKDSQFQLVRHAFLRQPQERRYQVLRNNLGSFARRLLIGRLFFRQ